VGRFGFITENNLVNTWLNLANPDKNARATDTEIHVAVNRSGSTQIINGHSSYAGNLNLGIGLDYTPQYHFNGDIAEVIIYNRVLTPEEPNTVEVHLFNKYGIQNYQSCTAQLTGFAPATVFSLELEHESGLRNRAWFEFSDYADLGKDAKDAYKLAPLSAEFGQLGSLLPDGKVLNINHLPLLDGTVQIPLHQNTSQNGLHSININRKNIPSDWIVKLVDNELQTQTRLDAAYEFYVQGSAAKRRVSADLVPDAELQYATASRFMLHIELNTTSVDAIIASNDIVSYLTKKT
jgi:hypothetical protein